jgi:hypothetical protein
MASQCTLPFRRSFLSHISNVVEIQISMKLSIVALALAVLVSNTHAIPVRVLIPLSAIDDAHQSAQFNREAIEHQLVHSSRTTGVSQAAKETFELSQFHHHSIPSSLQAINHFRLPPLDKHERYAIEESTKAHRVTHDFMDILKRPRSDHVRALCRQGLEIALKGTEHVEQACNQARMARSAGQNRDDYKFGALKSINHARVHHHYATQVYKGVLPLVSPRG